MRTTIDTTGGVGIRAQLLPLGTAGLLVVAAGLLVAGAGWLWGRDVGERLTCEIEAATARLTVTPAPTADWVEGQRARLDAQLGQVRAQRSHQEAALHRLARDHRWEDPGQAEHLARAMRQTAGAIREDQARAATLERQLSLLP